MLERRFLSVLLHRRIFNRLTLAVAAEPDAKFPDAFYAAHLAPRCVLFTSGQACQAGGKLIAAKWFGQPLQVRRDIFALGVARDDH